MSRFNPAHTSNTIYWIPSQQLENCWLPECFAPEFMKWDRLLTDRPDDYVRLGAVIRPLSLSPDVTISNADWYINARNGMLIADLVDNKKSVVPLQGVPDGALVLSPFREGNLPVFYWDGLTYPGTAATSTRNLILAPKGNQSVAWLVPALNSWECMVQLRRLTLGITQPRLEPHQLLEIFVPRRFQKATVHSGAYAMQADNRDSALRKKHRVEATQQSRFQPFILTGATFEERLRQFEDHLLQHGIISKNRVFFVEAASRDSKTDLFSVRLVGNRLTLGNDPVISHLRPQEDVEDMATWRNWYWDDSPDNHVAVFNALPYETALPALLLSRTIASPVLHRPPFSGIRVLPSFGNYRATVLSLLNTEEFDLTNVVGEVSALWHRHNEHEDDPEALLEWLRGIYRPVAIIKALRDGRTAGAYLVYGDEQLPNPYEALGKLDALALFMSDILRQPSEIIDAAARNESIRRLSWMMHQIAGPLMRIDGVIEDISHLLNRCPELADELVPSKEDAERQAAMNKRPIDCYSLASRIQDITEAAGDIRRLKKQVQDLKNAQKEPVYSKVNICQMLKGVSAGIEHNVPGLTCDIQCNDTLEVLLDESSISGALREVLGNALREFRERSIVAPRIILTVKSDNVRLTISISDNAFPVNEELIAKPFDEDATTYSKTGKGTGLGLTIVREIIHKHGGTCFLEANNDVIGSRIPGVTFRAEIPLMVEENIEE